MSGSTSVELADPGRGQIERRRRAQPAGADDQHPGGLQPLLARAADLAQHQVAGVALDLLVGKAHVAPGLTRGPARRHMRGRCADAFPDWHGTTILAVRKGGSTVIAGDGQVSMGQTIVKGNARRCAAWPAAGWWPGFAGATADAFTLIERLEAKLEQYPEQLARACVDLAKDWRTDRYLRRLEAMLIVADATAIFTVSGVGDVLEPEQGVAAIGSGGNYALAAARALMDFDLHRRGDRPPGHGASPPTSASTPTAS